ncbi:MAG TPA: hypothetical protein VIY56_11490 [Vicinamibacterales bacterium]
MGEFTYLVFLSVASVAAALIAVFAAGVGAVLLSSPGGEPHRRAHTATTHQVAERLAA